MLTPTHHSQFEVPCYYVVSHRESLWNRMLSVSAQMGLLVHLFCLCGVIMYVYVSQSRIMKLIKVGKLCSVHVKSGAWTEVKELFHI